MRLVWPVRGPIAAALLLLAMMPTVHADEAQPHVIRAWSDEGLTLEVTPLASEGTAAFLIGRGVPSVHARQYAGQCVLRLFFHDEEAGTIAYDLRRWTVRSGARTLPVTTREDWLERWRAPPLEPAARTGFTFSQFPSRSSLANGDSVQGLVTVPLPPGSRFALRFEWTASGTRHEKEIDDIACLAP